MIIKKLTLILMLFLLTNCGYEPIYSKKNILAISINKIELEGNKKINRMIINQTSLNKKDNKNYAYNLTLSSKKKIEVVTYNNFQNKFDLSKYQEHIEENMINDISEKIIIFLSS